MLINDLLHRRRVAVYLPRLLVAFLVVGGGLYWFAHKTIEIRFSQADLQQRFEKKLPLESKGPHHIYRISSGQVTLRPDGRIRVDFRFHVELVGRFADGRCLGSAVLDYRDGDFYLADMKTETIDLDNVVLRPRHPGEDEKTWLRIQSHLGLEEGHTDAEAVRSFLEFLLRETFDRQPIYRMDTSTRKRLVAKKMLREVRVENGVLIAVLAPATGLLNLF